MVNIDQATDRSTYFFEIHLKIIRCKIDSWLPYPCYFIFENSISIVFEGNSQCITGYKIVPPLEDADKSIVTDIQEKIERIVWSPGFRINIRGPINLVLPGCGESHCASSPTDYSRTGNC